MKELIIQIANYQTLRKAKTNRELLNSINNDIGFQYEVFHGVFAGKKIDYDEDPQPTIDAMVIAVNTMNDNLKLVEGEPIENMEQCDRLLEIIQNEKLRRVLIESLRKVKGQVASLEDKKDKTLLTLE